MWKAATLYTTRPAVVMTKEKKLLEKLLKSKPSTARDIGLTTRRAKSAGPRKAQDAKANVEKRSVVHDDLSESEDEHDQQRSTGYSVAKLFEAARHEFEAGDLSAVHYLLGRIIKAVGITSEMAANDSNLEVKEAINQAVEKSGLTLLKSERFLVSYIKLLGGNVDEVIGYLVKNRTPPNAPPTNSSVQDTEVEFHPRPKSARPNRNSQYPRASDFSDVGSENGFDSEADCDSESLGTKLAESKAGTKESIKERPEPEEPEVDEKDIESEFGPETVPGYKSSSQRASMKSLFEIDTLEEKSGYQETYESQVASNTGKPTSGSGSARASVSSLKGSKQNQNQAGEEKAPSARASLRVSFTNLTSNLPAHVTQSPSAHDSAPRIDVIDMAPVPEPTLEQADASLYDLRRASYVSNMAPSRMNSDMSFMYYPSRPASTVVKTGIADRPQSTVVRSTLEEASHEALNQVSEREVKLSSEEVKEDAVAEKHAELSDATVAALVEQEKKTTSKPPSTRSSVSKSHVESSEATPSVDHANKPTSSKPPSTRASVTKSQPNVFERLSTPKSNPSPRHSQTSLNKKPISSKPSEASLNPLTKDSKSASAHGSKASFYSRGLYSKPTSAHASAGKLNKDGGKVGSRVSLKDGDDNKPNAEMQEYMPINSQSNSSRASVSDPSGNAKASGRASVSGSTAGLDTTQATEEQRASVTKQEAEYADEEFEPTTEDDERPSTSSANGKQFSERPSRSNSPKPSSSRGSSRKSSRHASRSNSLLRKAVENSAAEREHHQGGSHLKEVVNASELSVEKGVEGELSLENGFEGSQPASEPEPVSRNETQPISKPASRKLSAKSNKSQNFTYGTSAPKQPSKSNSSRSLEKQETSQVDNMSRSASVEVV
ncbi:hypothetical protein HDV05_006524 [Chytridiales sp. JEL 0842]|nr:hypothetical protein HDV05_006524 [Chytridiales sp. JEL 0842]